ncbi:hypothetical protein ARMA_1473 [Ardenticatena maritima]|uniref:Methyltransferase domain-containing protein n=1 Tax=Ardenticatena maritima TaxID=872965 RepID=A0A0N0RFJ7_9CHLR|nr:class I SAM-dependent methyltransferase [Ardenticatena maritima]KPL89649.1 hypothetical protein SE16_04385 [Ardenticatena maritima]GAP63050.1 hypothetical protein ARMA_1473 [Ardenticatena maritima]
MTQEQDWFDHVYRQAAGDPSRVPWNRTGAHDRLLEWLAREQVDGTGKRALVVGCGMGRDAEALAAYGFKVVAFDRAPTAIAWCREAFANSPVQYVQADLFAPPAEWSQAFDFVLETFTLQALPAERRAEARARIADFVAPGGSLLVITFGRQPETVVEGPPWPLTRDEVEAFTEHGLRIVRFEDFRTPHPEWERLRWFRVHLRRPPTETGQTP